MTLAISRLTYDEVGAVCELARTVWRHHYPAIISTAQIEYMLEQRYDVALIREEIARRDIWWDVLSEDETIVAFASCAAEADGEVKLDKLYVHPERQRCGYGGALIEHACERAERFAYRKMILAVNKRNTSAIAAYQKYGFAIREAVVKDIGGGFVMDDYIMERLLLSHAVTGIESSGNAGTA